MIQKNKYYYRDSVTIQMKSTICLFPYNETKNIFLSNIDEKSLSCE